MTPLFLDLNSSDLVGYSSSSFGSKFLHTDDDDQQQQQQRSQEVAVFHFRAPVSPTIEGEETVVTVDTCGLGTTVGTLLSVFAHHCPDPWAAARDPAAYFSNKKNFCLGVNDDAPSPSLSSSSSSWLACEAGALTSPSFSSSSSGVVVSRASALQFTLNASDLLVPAKDDDNEGELFVDVFVLVQRDSSTDVVSTAASNSSSSSSNSSVIGTVQVNVGCAVSTYAPSSSPTLIPTPAPTAPFVTRVELNNASLRLEFATAFDFKEDPTATIAFQTAIAEVR